MKKKAAKKAKKVKRTRWVVICLGTNPHMDPWISSDVRNGSGRDFFLSKKAAVTAMKKYGSTSLPYTAVKE